ncbi:MAG TPA: hypothetical protein VE844_12720, partial [Gammaproteobacteria bacterium]|nr:hypothetical protein [Gammaproteobacteria bacterium]
MQWPYERNGKVTWGSALLQRLQKVRANCKTRNQLYGNPYMHDFVKHTQKEYARGEVHENRAECL